MEQQPHNPDDDQGRGVPELERLWSGEIDMTGVVSQDDALVDVIGDAIGEAEASGGEVPEWGARTLARALANERDDPQSGALHHFAVTGRVDKDAIGRELAEIYASTSDDEVKEWVNWLGTYIVHLPDDDGAAPEEGGHEQQSALEVPVDGTPSEKVSAYLRIAFAEADARGEPVALEDAQTVAAMLAGFLVVMGVKDSAMMRLAESGEVDLPKLHDECRQLKAVAWRIQDIHIWVEHLEQYLERPNSGDNPQVEGAREHGDAFRAYLQLPDVDPEHPNLLTSFQDVYIGSFTHMHELLDELTDVTKGLAAVTKTAEAWGLEEFVTLNEAALIAVAHSTWDIVEYQGRLYVFTK